MKEARPTIISIYTKSKKRQNGQVVTGIRAELAGGWAWREGRERTFRGCGNAPGRAAVLGGRWIQSLRLTDVVSGHVGTAPSVTAVRSIQAVLHRDLPGDTLSSSLTAPPPQHQPQGSRSAGIWGQHGWCHPPQERFGEQSGRCRPRGASPACQAPCRGGGHLLSLGNGPPSLPRPRQTSRPGGPAEEGSAGPPHVRLWPDVQRDAPPGHSGWAWPWGPRLQHGPG